MTSRHSRLVLEATSTISSTKSATSLFLAFKFEPSPSPPQGHSSSAKTWRLNSLKVWGEGMQRRKKNVRGTQSVPQKLRPHSCPPPSQEQQGTLFPSSPLSATSCHPLFYLWLSEIRQRVVFSSSELLSTSRMTLF